MISLEEIKEKQEELNKMIEELENKKDNLKWDKNWKPKENDNYYLINKRGKVDYYTNINNKVDEEIIKYSRVFKTEKQAEKWLEIDTYLREKSFEPDWNDDEQRKYYIIYDYENDKFNYSYHLDVLCFEPFYFESEEIVEEILEKYTTEELKFYFNIGE